MSQALTREAVFLADYRPPAYLTPAVELDFSLDPDATLVTSRQTFLRNPKADGGAGDLVLFGEDQELLELRLEGAPLPPQRFRQESDRLVLSSLPERFELEVKSRIAPAANSKLMGLYLSNGVFCTQCEPEALR